MTDPTGGSIANISVAMLKRVAMANGRGAAAVAAEVQRIAGQLGMSPAAVIRGIAVSAGSTSAAAASWAKTATVAVQGAIEAGALVATEATAAAGAAGAGAAATGAGGAAAGSTGIVGWFTGLTIGAKVAVLVAAGVLTAGVAQAAGWLSADSPSAIPGSGPGTSAPIVTTPTLPPESYVAVGVYFDGNLRIVSVRSAAAVAEGIAPCAFRHGGIDCDSQADVRPFVAGDFATAEEATEAACDQLGGPPYPPPLADGWVAPYGSGTVTVDDWGALDLSVCDEVTGG